LTLSRSTKAQTPVKGSAKCAVRTHRRKTVKGAFVPGAVSRKAAKALDSGTRSEDVAEKLLIGRKCMLDVWRNPGVLVPRLSGIGGRPDLAGYMLELRGLAVENAPDVKDPRPDYNVLIEVKAQRSTGSAYLKISTAIVDMAHASDATGAVGIVILDVPVLSPTTISGLKDLGRKHSVVVMTMAEANRVSIREEAIRVAKERLKFPKYIGPKGGIYRDELPKRPSRQLAAFIDRWRDRRGSNQLLNQPGAAALPSAAKRIKFQLEPAR
jgi:hypothetical protein